jgi:cytidine deaminase
VSQPHLPPETTAALLERAREARARAYAPYSGFPVGAALLASNGEVILGANVENAAHPLGMCAERVAVGAAVAAGLRRFDAVAVVGPPGEPCPPCGGCRQVLHEFAPDLRLVTEGPDGPRIRTLRELLPDAFGPSRPAGTDT